MSQFQRTRQRIMRGIPKITAQFGKKDDSPFAPLHRRLGINTHVHRQAVLAESNRRFGALPSWDGINRVTSDSHLYRVSITLAGAA